jgi:hypothetical protein
MSVPAKKYLDPYLTLRSCFAGVGKKEWLYSCAFDLSAEQLAHHVELEFEGLDTFCTAYLVSCISHRVLGITLTHFL